VHNMDNYVYTRSRKIDLAVLKPRHAAGELRNVR